MKHCLRQIYMQILTVEATSRSPFQDLHRAHAWTTLPLLAGSPVFFLPVVLQGGHRGRNSSAAFSPSRPLESDVCLADVLQLLSSSGPSAALFVDIDCMFVLTVHGTRMQPVGLTKSS
ncbi:hypothetical protein WJX82_002581 [Trebouxia sp. C0006]